MAVGFVRPDVSDLGLAVFGRALHPELLTFREQATIKHHQFEARVAICDAGHLLELRTGHQTVCEVVAPLGQPLPKQFRFWEKKLRGGRDQSLSLPGGISYQLSFHVERLDPDRYLTLHDEFSEDCRKATLGHVFTTPNRLAPAAISYLQADLFPHSLLVHAFHTFPENCAVVKIQTLIELAD